MKKFLTILVLLNSVAFAQTADSTEVKTSRGFRKISTGPILQLSFFNYFNVGLGYDFGEIIINGSHGNGREYGVLVEFDSKKEMHFRSYYNIEGGSAFLLLGASAVVAKHSDKTAVGIAPHIGLFFLYYRYNFYTNSKFNRHELLLFPIYPFAKEK
jgi:hypothetical protein